ncbi:PTB domain-containing engulfment adapter protein 1-like isoform X5 [Linepithema humile]|uniref:PTB domain-containing engulfment adapter protein 1-like isoform X5 n=1 Tax=Linepithema humile TaxID=83485 RepID=UPI00351E1C6D
MDSCNFNENTQCSDGRQAAFCKEKTTSVGKRRCEISRNELCEEWALANSRECVESGSSASTTHGEESEDASEARFTLKYLGSTLVETPSSEEATAEAIKTVITMAKASGKKLQRVSLAVSLRGIRMTDLATEEDQLQVSIYRISYCSADATHDHVFAFIATNLNETMECHAFLCPKRKMAQTVTLTVAQAFNTAYQAWQLSQSDPRIHHAQDKNPPLADDRIDNNEKKEASETKTTTGKVNEQNKQNGQQRRNDSQKNLLIDLSNESKPAGNSWGESCLFLSGLFRRGFGHEEKSEKEHDDQQ